MQGYGTTEDGTVGNLLETNVTIINNRACKEQFEKNITAYKYKAAVSQKLCKALPFGLNDALLCAQGIQNQDGVFSGSCKGDSGGPMTAQDDENKKTLIGIVSGCNIITKQIPHCNIFNF